MQKIKQLLLLMAFLVLLMPACQPTEAQPFTTIQKKWRGMNGSVGYDTLLFNNDVIAKAGFLDETTLMIAGEDSLIKIFDLKSKKIISVIPSEYSSYAACNSATSEIIYPKNADTMILFNWKNKSQKFIQFDLDPYNRYDIYYTPSGKWLFTGNEQRDINTLSVIKSFGSSVDYKFERYWPESYYYLFSKDETKLLKVCSIFIIETELSGKLTFYGHRIFHQIYNINSSEKIFESLNPRGSLHGRFDGYELLDNNTLIYDKYKYDISTGKGISEISNDTIFNKVSDYSLSLDKILLGGSYWDNEFIYPIIDVATGEVLCRLYTSTKDSISSWQRFLWNSSNTIFVWINNMNDRDNNNSSRIHIWSVNPSVSGFNEEIAVEAAPNIIVNSMTQNIIATSQKIQEYPVEIELVSLTGKSVLRQVVDPNPSGSVRISTASLSPGFYIVALTCQGSRTSKPIVIIK